MFIAEKLSLKPQLAATFWPDLGVARVNKCSLTHASLEVNEREGKTERECTESQRILILQ